MKRIFIFVMTSILIFSHSYAYEEFADMEKHWAKNIISVMLQDNVVSKTKESLFYPDKEITVEEFLKILVLQANYKLVTIGNRWPDWYVNTAIANNIILQDEFDDYQSQLLRKDAVSIISNYVGLKDVPKAKNSFKDLSKEIKDDVLKLVHLKIISGFNDGTFRENEPVTRAQACKIIFEAYNAKNEINLNRKFDLSWKNSNIGEAKSGDLFYKTRYEIKNGRIYINDFGKYARLYNATLNQEYIKDEQIIRVLKSLASDDSYTAVLFVPDKYTINTVNICYGNREEYVNNGNYCFQFRFYENGYYHLAAETEIDGFSDNIVMRIELDKMWDKLSEFNNEYRASAKNLNRLENALKSIFGESTTKELMKYIKEKLIEIKDKPDNSEELKICETKKFGKYTFDVMCCRNENIQLYLRK